MQEYTFYKFSKMHLNGKNPLPLTIDESAPKGYLNAYIPSGANKGIHIFISIPERTIHIMKRDFELAWLDMADHSSDLEGWLDEGAWLQAYWRKYGKVNQ